MSQRKRAATPKLSRNYVGDESKLTSLRQSDFDEKTQHDSNELRAEVHHDYNEANMATTASGKALKHLATSGTPGKKFHSGTVTGGRSSRSSTPSRKSGGAKGAAAASPSSKPAVKVFPADDEGEPVSLISLLVMALATAVLSTLIMEQADARGVGMAFLRANFKLVLPSAVAVEVLVIFFALALVERGTAQPNQYTVQRSVALKGFAHHGNMKALVNGASSNMVYSVAFFLISTLSPLNAEGRLGSVFGIPSKDLISFDLFFNNFPGIVAALSIVLLLAAYGAHTSMSQASVMTLVNSMIMYIATFWMTAALFGGLLYQQGRL